MLGAHEICLEGSVVSFEVEDDAIEVGADGVVAIFAPIPTAFKLHPGFFEADAAVAGVDLIFYNAFQNGAVAYSDLEVDLIVFNLDCIDPKVPKSKRTKHVTW